MFRPVTFLLFYYTCDLVTYTWPYDRNKKFRHSVIYDEFNFVYLIFFKFKELQKVSCIKIRIS